MVLSAMFYNPGFILVGLVGLILDIYCLVDVVRRPDWQWQASGQSKTLWLVLTIIGLLICSIVVAILYLVIPRPKLVRAEQGGGPMGGYGPPPGAYGGGYPPPGGYSSPYGGDYGAPGYTPPPVPPTTTYSPPSGGYQPPASGYQPPAGGYTPPPSPPTTVHTPSPASPPPGWYPDPAGSGQPRYWNGQEWSEHGG